MRSIVALLFVLVLAAGAAGWWVKFEHNPPTATLDTRGPVVGPHGSWDLVVRAPGWPGLRRVEILLAAGGGLFPAFTKDYPARSWVGSGISEDRFRVEVEPAALDIQEGPALVRVVVETYAWQVLSPRQRIVVEKEIKVDLTPPSVELLSTQHNLRLGGSGVAVFRVSEDTVDAGIVVGHYFFPATRGYFADPAVAVALFAVPQDLSTDVRVDIRATDAVGNSRTVLLPRHVRNRHFAERTLNITDQFLEQKVPEILAANRAPRQPDLVRGYLYINNDLRAETERQLHEVTRVSRPEPLWSGPFRRQPNAAPMSGFGDRRTYVYGGEAIDHQTHLGYDLASVAGATIEAAQDGIVVSAGNLGIYGETVVIDHGLGLFSLYGHMRTIGVRKGQRVSAGEAIGQSGMTGLAGGDHLHFSVMIYGIHVDPLEWWDPHWLRTHVTSNLTMLPAAPVEKAAPALEETNEKPAA